MKTKLLALLGIVTLAVSALAQTTGITINHATGRMNGQNTGAGGTYGDTMDVPLWQVPQFVLDPSQVGMQLKLSPSEVGFYNTLAGASIHIIPQASYTGVHLITAPQLDGVMILDAGAQNYQSTANKTWASGATETFSNGSHLNLNGEADVNGSTGKIVVKTGGQIQLQSGAQQSFASGSTITFNGTINGNATGGALDWSAVTLTLPGVFVRTDGTYTNPSWIPGFDASKITSGAVAVANGGTGQTSASAAINALVPSQSGQSGKVLGTNGSAVSWVSGGSGGFSDPNVAYIAASPTGNDTTGNGSPSAPYATAQKAVDMGFRVLRMGVGSFGTVTFPGTGTGELWIMGCGTNKTTLGTISNPGQTLSVHDVYGQSVDIVGNLQTFKAGSDAGPINVYDITCFGQILTYGQNTGMFNSGTNGGAITVYGICNLGDVYSNGGAGGDGDDVTSGGSGGNGGAIIVIGASSITNIASSGGPPGVDNGGGTQSPGTDGGIGLNGFPRVQFTPTGPVSYAGAIISGIVYGNTSTALP